MIYYFQKGFNFSQDGPGNRLVYHLCGCNMKCPWCSNPEGMIKSDNAIGIEVPDLAKEIYLCKPMFFGGGGVTFSGGECTLQWNELSAVYDILHAKKVNVAIESNAATEDFVAAANKVDYVMCDFKSPLETALKDTADGDLQLIKSNIIAASENNFLHIRIPLIHHFNDDDISLDGFVEFFKTLNNFDVEILPYHEYGKEKWKKLGLEYKVKGGRVSKETVQKFKDTFSENGIKLLRT